MLICRTLARVHTSRGAVRPRSFPEPIARCTLRPLSTDTKHTPNVPRARRIPLRYIWYFSLLSLGFGAGGYLQGFATARLRPPSPGTEEDAAALDALGDQMDELEIVKTMRAHTMISDSGRPKTQSGNLEAGWVELQVQDNIAQVAKDGYRTRPLTQLAMAGIQGLGVQRAFWNTETREIVAVIWVGPRLSGWPGIAHGGAIATVFEEIMSRMIAGPGVSIGMLIRFYFLQ